MTITLDQLRQHLLALPSDDRARLADELLESLEPPNPEVDRLWLEEARRRWAELQADPSQTLSIDQLFDQQEPSRSEGPIDTRRPR
jgi:putative addiction module component (TIGR02574 family)